MKLRPPLAALTLLVIMLPSADLVAVDLPALPTEAIAQTVDTLGQRIADNQIINRSPADLASWAIMGMLIGSLAGYFSPLGTTLPGRLARLVVGLAGAFIGGMVARVAELDFGWPAIQLPLEELALSVVGAVVLVAVIRLVRAQMEKTERALTRKAETRAPHRNRP